MEEPIKDCLNCSIVIYNHSKELNFCYSHYFSDICQLILLNMLQISEEVINTSIEFINSASEDVLNDYSERYADTQESLVGYVFQTAAEDDDDELLSYFVYYYTLIMHIFENSGKKLPVIDDAFIDAFHEDYLELIDEYTESEDFSELVDFIGQPVLIDFLLHDISTADDEGNMIDEEMQNILSMVLIGLVGILTKVEGQ